MQLPWTLRWLALLAGLCVLALLLVARQLEPSPFGYGTHQQLGLPPCSSLVLFGSTCPACGMTTAWAWTTRGQIWPALQANAGGAMLALIAMAYLPSSCYFFAGGRTSRKGWFSLALGNGLLVSLGVAIVQWALRLVN